MGLDVYLIDPTATYKEDVGCLYGGGTTHNLGEMARAVGLYEVLWHPERKGYKVAGHIIKPLEKGLKKLKDNPKEMRRYESPNGWGTYPDFVKFVESYLEACKKYPEAILEAST